MDDLKRKLTSRKFWMAIAEFVSMLLVYFGTDIGQSEKIAALIMAGASVIAYIIGEGLADRQVNNDRFIHNYNAPYIFGDNKESEE